MTYNNLLNTFEGSEDKWASLSSCCSSSSFVATGTTHCVIWCFQNSGHTVVTATACSYLGTRGRHDWWVISRAYMLADPLKCLGMLQQASPATLEHAVHITNKLTLEVPMSLPSTNHIPAHLTNLLTILHPGFRRILEFSRPKFVLAPFQHLL
jgi:hypothetical protein